MFLGMGKRELYKLTFPRKSDQFGYNNCFRCHKWCDFFPASVSDHQEIDGDRK